MNVIQPLNIICTECVSFPLIPRTLTDMTLIYNETKGKDERSIHKLVRFCNR